MTIRSTPSQRQDEQTPQHPSIVDLSPFQNGPTWKPASVVETPEYGANIGAVISLSEQVDDDGVPVRATMHYVGAACLHWAPEPAKGDCRFACRTLGKVVAA